VLAHAPDDLRQRLGDDGGIVPVPDHIACWQPQLYVDCQDGHGGSDMTDVVCLPTVSQGNHDPVLSNPTVSPIIGTTLTNFTYYATYQDSDGDSPSPIEVNIDGSGGSHTHPMTYVSGSVTTGALYQYQTTLPVAATASTGLSRRPRWLRHDGRGIWTVGKPSSKAYAVRDLR